MRIAICDDDKMDLLYIHKNFENTFINRNVDCDFTLYTDVNKFLNENSVSPFDVVFLDIDMPEMNGLEAASHINKLDACTEIVFVTNHDELVYKAYKFKALGFIRKKFLTDEAEEIVDLIVENVTSRYKYVLIQASGVDYKFNVNEIIFMQSDDHYVDIFSNGRKDTVRYNLNSMEKQFSQHGFIRIHSRYLVNYRYIYSIEKSVIILTNKQQLPLSRSKINSVKDAFQFFSRRL